MLTVGVVAVSRASYEPEELLSWSATSASQHARRVQPCVSRLLNASDVCVDQRVTTWPLSLQAHTVSSERDAAFALRASSQLTSAVLRYKTHKFAAEVGDARFIAHARISYQSRL